MGGCVSSQKNPKVQILKKAYDTFQILDKNKNGKIITSDIQQHFGSYSQTSAKIMMREIDLDNNGVITKNDWLGYWQLVRRAGYRPAQIMKQLNSINQGILTLNFPNVSEYKKEVSRSTAVSSIVNDLKAAPPQQLPFSLQKQ